LSHGRIAHFSHCNATIDAKSNSTLKRFCVGSILQIPERLFYRIALSYLLQRLGNIFAYQVFHGFGVNRRVGVHEGLTDPLG